MIQLKDNSDVTGYQDNLIIQELLDRNLNDLAKENFIIFPPQIGSSEDLDGENYIFRQHNRRIQTGNIVGVMKKGSDEVRINSRFYDSISDSEDYFLKYLLHRVLSMNIIRTKVSMDSDDSYYNLLAFLFPMYLNQAMEKGVYKEYVKKQYNDANVKGPINVARHIKANTPFVGRIAYDTREFSYDNRLTQLIRHTLEKLNAEYIYDFASDSLTKENMTAIIRETSSYSRSERFEILAENVANPVRHGYFEEYYLLQKLCIQILNEQRVGFGIEDDEVHGIIIDVAWLWEEYLNTLLKEQFIHPENKNSRYGISLFSDMRHTVYPDFYSRDKRIVLDAKYKQLDRSEKGLNREDRYQIISYLHVLKAEKAGIAYPSKETESLVHVGTLHGFGGQLFKLPLKVPQNMSSYDEFSEQIIHSESCFKSKVLTIQ
ncbi:3-isopropylmalate dehydrogenase [Ligilactobacillus sp. WILCCON 0076]|uniref:3-isopropylmalate dehydrogenase n=1 Tax=Ligilactobacillus ubinensis TaxID=2876789 RepID=A0A9X2FK32_9LACO|nr:3-isopropylmalate dehydrogenase [Ligilactobacillus ubinensis]MCP0887137.1 3-isopropylmalate dehydrogenase [Ligilactobacillus ubinensis]